MPDQTLALHGGKPAVRPPLHYGKGLAAIGDEETQAVVEVLRARSLFRYYGGQVREFEKELAKQLGARFAIGCSSGTAALRMSLAAVGVGPGDEVLVPAMTFIATVNAVVAQRACPVFVDVDELLMMDSDDMARRIGPRTKAILPVHMFGIACDMERIIEKARGIPIIEDAAQACGVTYQGKRLGTRGQIAAFSFQQEKIITAGEGGAILTDDEELYDRAFKFHDQGGRIDTRRTVRDTVGGQAYFGENLRMGEIAGALLRCQLRRLDGMLESMSRIRHALLTELRDTGLAFIDDGERARYSDALGFALETPELASAFVSALQAEGVPADKIYGGRPVYAAAQVLEQRTFAGGCPFHCPSAHPNPPRYSEGMCPRAEHLIPRVVGIGMGPFYTEDNIADLASAVRKVARALRG